MNVFSAAGLVEDIVKRNEGQSASLAKATSESRFQFNSSLEPTRSSLNTACRNLRQAERELQTLKKTHLKHFYGAQKARATLDCVLSYASSRSGAHTCQKLAKDSIESPLDFLQDIAEQFSKEISSCESMLGGLLTIRPISETGAFSQNAALSSLTGATKQMISVTKAKLANFID